MSPPMTSNTRSTPPTSSRASFSRSTNSPGSGARVRVASGPRLALPQHLQCSRYATLACLVAPRVVDPARVLLAVGVSQPIEGDACLGVLGQGVCERLRDFDLSGSGVEIQGDVNGVAGVDA